jgi:hypothetical protein
MVSFLSSFSVQPSSFDTLRKPPPQDAYALGLRALNGAAAGGVIVTTAVIGVSNVADLHPLVAEQQPAVHREPRVFGQNWGC